ncbi:MULTISPECIES: helix-turn-helix domain-containing protein [Bacillus subtilis group]|uniref:helix-turn-helix domain-containing protein n=1 Tax=Bacillus subtilis group TaxID=653685 RepID=UPI00227F7F70|nr:MULTISPECIES: helix-turn-helix transcriptional regulator [Bacillus subtilis group]MCY7823288.1 helix-turn-helix transcriptional regulator [Bacillus spizizenii]MCY7933901.1 helix-turn-helix transcriptional regulator [Bacillus spizizenii]MCY7943907.1 helix-turn-helix transcriptional regulator [Bacillus inaquosorum]MCY8229296.1 helix-turn-helix transcriptional regulator [Bacillus spizizenii]MCY8798210.1 helix-turn-helix transcriptional regulator [Bacillus inaquosorum]
MIKVEIGQCLIPELCRKKDITINELSEITGIKKQQLSDYNRLVKVDMSIRTAKRIAAALDCNVEDLYEFKVVRH